MQGGWRSDLRLQLIFLAQLLCFLLRRKTNDCEQVTEVAAEQRLVQPV